jgi:hypothetical protein
MGFQMEDMKKIASLKAKEERKRLESEVRVLTNLLCNDIVVLPFIFVIKMSSRPLISFSYFSLRQY